MDMSSFSLSGKIALITGASYGIGFAIAKGMAAAGATIVFNDIKRASTLTVTYVMLPMRRLSTTWLLPSRRKSA